MGIEAGVEIAKALQENDTIETLDLRATKGDEAVCAEWGETLAKNATLLQLDLSWNSLMGPEVLASLARNSTLTHLNLSWCGLGDGCIDALISALSENKTLRELSLSNNHFTGDCAERLIEALGGNTTLAFLDLSHNPVGKEGWKLLRPFFDRWTYKEGVAGSHRHSRINAAEAGFSKQESAEHASDATCCVREFLGCPEVRFDGMEAYAMEAQHEANEAEIEERLQREMEEAQAEVDNMVDIDTESKTDSFEDTM